MGQRSEQLKLIPVSLAWTPGGVLGISSDRDDQMEPKVKTQKNPLTKN